jgi:hypothetical protein
MTITVGQVAQIIQSGSNPTAISFSALPNPGSRIVIPGERYSAIVGSPSATDNQTGNTYQVEFQQAQNGEYPWLIDSVSGIAAPSGTFTVSVSLSADLNVGMLELRGTTGYNAACQALTGGTVSGSFAASLTAAAPTAVGDSIVMAMFWMDTFAGSGFNPGWSTPTGWNGTPIIINNGSGRIGRIDYSVLTTIQTPVANWGTALTGVGSTGNWEAAIWVYSGSVPASGPPRPSLLFINP